MRRGMTLVELLTGMALFALLVLGSMSLLAGSLRSFQRTESDTTMGDQSARAIRKIAENLRGAVAVTVTNSGRTLAYSLPALTAGTDPLTGEREVSIPPISDGTIRTYTVDFGAGVLRDGSSGRVMVQNVWGRDTDPGSSQYNQVYAPFEITTIGTRKALTITLVTRDNRPSQVRTSRMRTTTILRNVP